MAGKPYMLEPELQCQLFENDFFRLLKEELQQEGGNPFHNILSYRGNELYTPPDRVSIQPDDLIKNLEDDLLGGIAFASYLERRISVLSSTQSAYAIHSREFSAQEKSTVFICPGAANGCNWLCSSRNCRKCY